MGFLRKLFGRKDEYREENESWEQPVYARDGVDFSNEEQRSRYVTNCLEQIAEASGEISILTAEYTVVNTYLADTEEIDALPESEKEQVAQLAQLLTDLAKDRQRIAKKKNRMSDAEYNHMRRQEDEVAEGIEKLTECENYAKLVKQDMARLDRERHAFDYRKQDLLQIMSNCRGLAVIFMTALAVCVCMLLIMHFGFQMDTMIAFFIAVPSGAAAITWQCIRYLDAQKELRRVGQGINKLIQLQNRVKIRYVNNTNLLEYLCMKYQTDCSAKLKKDFENYQKEKEERKQFAELEAKTELYQRKLMKQLSIYHISDPLRFVNQPGALFDKRELVEMRHELILRRQALRKQLDYNRDIAEAAKKEIKEIVEQYPAYAQEILEMVNHYE